MLIDGRSIYSPSFSGVYWEVQDTLMEDIERIEVIRGPGATLWGANAVNGVINVITKHSEKTRGGSITGGGGTFESGFGSVRYGAKLGEKGNGRVYLKSFERNNLNNASGKNGDRWNMIRTGFRYDYDSLRGESASIQGDYYQGNIRQLIGVPTLSAHYSRPLADQIDTSGWNLLGRWKKALGLDSDINLQIYFDHTQRDENILDEKRDTFDIDFQHHFALGQYQDVIWGVGYRLSKDQFRSSREVALLDPERDYNLFSAYLQDEISLFDREIRITFGTKLEHNDYTGVEVQPNARIIWVPNTHHSVWGAISRAVRTPSRYEDNGDIPYYHVLAPSSPGNPSPFPVQLMFRGNEKIQAENILAYELGYRFMPKSNLSFDLSLFYNDYDDLRSVEHEPLYLSEFILRQPATLQNNLQGQTYGAELFVDWHPFDWWSFQMAYTYLDMQFKTTSGSLRSGAPFIEGSSPEQQLSIRTGFNITPNLQLDFWVRYVDRLPSSGVPINGLTTPIDDHITMDIRLAWQPAQYLDFSVVGQNLLQGKHIQMIQEGFGSQPTQIDRSVYFQAKLLF